MNEIKHIDRKEHPPTLVDAHGEAWQIDVARSRALAGENEESDSTVALWIVYAPWAHPFWSYYFIGAIHLRPIPKLPPAKINLPGATHEVIVFALSPDFVPDPVDSKKNRRLSPVNFVGQWIVPDRPNPVDLDRGAREKIDGVVLEIIRGKLSPDTDFRHQWVLRFSASNRRGSY
jgi:hypothetical protein